MGGPQAVLQDLRLLCDGTKGLWVPHLTSGEYPAEAMKRFYDEAVGGGNAADGGDALVELQCEPRTVGQPNDVLTVNPTKTGGLLNCENLVTTTPTGEYQITPPNTCILLCDFHLGMTIKGKLNDRGYYEFTKVETGEIITQDNVDNQIKCW